LLKNKKTDAKITMIITTDAYKVLFILITKNIKLINLFHWNFFCEKGSLEHALSSVNLNEYYNKKGSHKHNQILGYALAESLRKFAFDS
jgi:hypothetical protein